MINHKNALRTQLQCDAWASLSELHDSVLRSELNYPLRPALLLLYPAVLPFNTLPNPPILHSMEQQGFLFFFHRTTPLHCHFQKTLELEVHYMLSTKFISLHRSGSASRPER